ncbi:MAG: hypothetical protein ACR2H1_11795 [Limisphaerales bacterium]
MKIFAISARAFCLFLAGQFAVAISLPAAPKLESDSLSVRFDSNTGGISHLKNKLTGEEWKIRPDDFQVKAGEFVLNSQSARLLSLKRKAPDSVEAIYSGNGWRVVTTYRLGRTNNFLEKHLTVQSPTAFAWKEVQVSRISFPDGDLHWQKYPHQKTATFFGRTARGGLFLGVEKPFDTSTVEGNGHAGLCSKSQGESQRSFADGTNLHRCLQKKRERCRHQQPPVAIRIRRDGADDHGHSRPTAT